MLHANYVNRHQKLHANVTEIAELAQKHHDTMVESYRKADKSREMADASHKSFVESQESADFDTNFLLLVKKSCGITIRLLVDCERRRRR